MDLIPRQLTDMDLTDLTVETLNLPLQSRLAMESRSWWPKA
jgi:hypothetical protein